MLMRGEVMRQGVLLIGWRCSAACRLIGRILSDHYLTTSEEEEGKGTNISAPGKWGSSFLSLPSPVTSRFTAAFPRGKCVFLYPQIYVAFIF
jgi:hypothetical protein